MQRHNEVKAIPLRTRKIVAGEHGPLSPLHIMKLDDEDAAELKRRGLPVFATRSGNGGKPYAAVRLDGKNVRLHRLILSAGPGQITDHLDRDPLNNQRSNLRICTRSENDRNRSKRKDSTTRFLGVSPNYSKWRARLKRDSHQFNLGDYSTQEEAARVRDLAVLAMDGHSFALNFPGDNEVHVHARAWSKAFPAGVEIAGDDFPIVVVFHPKAEENN